MVLRCQALNTSAHTQTVRPFLSAVTLCYNFAMSTDAKVLSGLMERRALETAFAELAETSDLEALTHRAQELAQHGAPALKLLIQMLDTDNPQLRGGLGQVAKYLDRAQVVPLLKAVAASRTRSDLARLSAITILDRFLGEPVEDALLVGLAAPDQVALHSLRELVQAMAQDPMAIIEYLNQLNAQPPDVPHLLLAALPQMPGDPHLVTLLRVFAQAPDPRLAHDALEQLSRTRAPEAALALDSLRATLPPALASLAERGRRKLRLSGISISSAPSLAGVPWFVSNMRWRVLISPVDGTGAQLLWFIGEPLGEAFATLISIVIQDPKGIVIASGTLKTPQTALPPARGEGSLHRIAGMQRRAPVMLVEASLEAGRQALREALTQNWASDTPTPLEYRLFNPLIWLAQAEEHPEGHLLQTLAAQNATRFGTAADASLLNHPAFFGWFWPTPNRQGLNKDPGSDRSDAVTRVIRADFGPDIVASYARRLRRMAVWLTFAGEQQTASLAQTAAEQLSTEAPETCLFIRRLVEIGLDATEEPLPQHQPARQSSRRRN